MPQNKDSSPYKIINHFKYICHFSNPAFSQELRNPNLTYYRSFMWAIIQGLNVFKFKFKFKFKSFYSLKFHKCKLAI